MTDEQTATEPAGRVTYLPVQRVTQVRRWGRGWDRKTLRGDDSRWAADEWATVVAIAITERADVRRLDVHYVDVYGGCIESNRLVDGTPGGCPADEIEEDEPDPYYWEVRELVDGEWVRIT